MQFSLLGLYPSIVSHAHIVQGTKMQRTQCLNLPALKPSQLREFVYVCVGVCVYVCVNMHVSLW